MSRKEKVNKIIAGFMESRVDEALSCMHDDVQLGWPGHFDLPPGKEPIKEFMTNMPSLQEYTIDKIIEAEDYVISSGQIITSHEDGDTRTSYFCDLYCFRGDLVSKIESYVIFQDEEGV